MENYGPKKRQRTSKKKITDGKAEKSSESENFTAAPSKRSRIGKQRQDITTTDIQTIAKSSDFPSPEKNAFLALLCGRRLSGKSWLLCDLILTIWKGMFDEIVVLSKTFRHQDCYKQLKGRIMVIEEWDPAVFDAVLAHQKTHPKEKLLVLIDDMSDEGRNDPQPINNFAYIGRHFRISVAWLVQRCGLATPAFRQECDAVILFREENRRERSLLYQDWGLGDRQVFMQKILKLAEKEYSFVMLRNIKGIVTVFHLDNPAPARGNSGKAKTDIIKAVVKDKS